MSGDETSSQTVAFRTITLLPWLPLQGPISFASLRFEPLSSVAPRLQESERESVRLVGGTFGSDVDPAICWLEKDGAVPTLTELDAAAVHDRVGLLAVAAVESNEYFAITTPANAAHFEVVFQRFTPTAEYFAIERRRRDGESLSGGHTYRETRFHRPQATFGRTRIRWDQGLLDALGTCLGADESLSSRIRQSSVAFAAANRLDDFSSFEFEVVWAATALEQLLGVSDRNPKEGITKAFVERLVSALTGPHTTPGERTMLRRWARELYAKRSEVHGRPAKSNGWSYGWHAMLATVAYGICVKQLLAGAGRYTLSQDDGVEVAAFPWRVTKLRNARLPDVGDAGSAWGIAREKASWRCARLRAMAMLRERS